MSSTARYYGKLFIGSIVAYLVLDNYTGTAAITKSTFSGLGGLASTLQGRSGAVGAAA